MKRFTKRIDEHVYYTMGQYKETLSAECTSQDVRQILKHLADYEDSNLTPEEISSLIATQKAIIEIAEKAIEQLGKMDDPDKIEKFAEEALQAIRGK